MGKALAPTVWIPLHSLEPAHRPVDRPGALSVLAQLEGARSLAAATEPDTGLLKVAIATVNARLLHTKLAAREVLAAEHEPQFAAYCRMIGPTLDPLRTMLADQTPTAAAARIVLAGVRIQIDALAAMAGGTDAGAPAVFEDLQDQLEAMDLFLLAS